MKDMRFSAQLLCVCLGFWSYPLSVRAGGEIEWQADFGTDGKNYLRIDEEGYVTLRVSGPDVAQIARENGADQGIWDPATSTFLSWEDCFHGTNQYHIHKDGRYLFNTQPGEITFSKEEKNYTDQVDCSQVGYHYQPGLFGKPGQYTRDEFFDEANAQHPTGRADICIHDKEFAVGGTQYNDWANADGVAAQREWQCGECSEQKLKCGKDIYNTGAETALGDEAACEFHPLKCELGDLAGKYGDYELGTGRMVTSPRDEWLVKDYFDLGETEATTRAILFHCGGEYSQYRAFCAPLRYVGTNVQKMPNVDLDRLMDSTTAESGTSSASISSTTFAVVVAVVSLLF